MYFFKLGFGWAGNSIVFQFVCIKSVLLVVYVLNLILFSMMIASIAQPRLIFFTVLLLAAKAAVEYSFMNRAARFFGKKELMKWFLLVQPMYVLYIVGSATMGFFKSYEWKGRKVR